MDKEKVKTIFKTFVESIYLSYTCVDNENKKLKKAYYDLEAEMTEIYSKSKAFKEQKVSIYDFKREMFSVMTRETNEMTIADDKGNEISDEQKAYINFVAINDLNKQQLENFATNLYSCLSKSRNLILTKLTKDASIFIAKRDSIMPLTLNVFEEKKGKEPKRDK